MEHPLHDDSHLGEGIDNNDDNRELLIKRILDKKVHHEIREMAWHALEEVFKSDDIEFQESWNLYMEG